MVSAAIPIPQKQVEDFCRRHHILKMALFGSVLRDDFCPQSDVDVLVEFEPEHVPGLSFFDIQDELTELFQRQVDLVTFKGLSKYIRKKVLKEAQPVYVQA
jgi:predicted nucleotidyltransferase